MRHCAPPHKNGPNHLGFGRRSGGAWDVPGAALPVAGLAAGAGAAGGGDRPDAGTANLRRDALPCLTPSPPSPTPQKPHTRTHTTSTGVVTPPPAPHIHTHTHVPCRKHGLKPPQNSPYHPESRSNGPNHGLMALITSFFGRLSRSCTPQSSCRGPGRRTTQPRLTSQPPWPPPRLGAAAVRSAAGRRRRRRRWWRV